MASTHSETISMALFCDFENVALGVRDAKYDKFDIKRILERLLLKGSIVVKKAYCDWERYKGFKATMHEANFELIEIPHVRQSGKNSADIRLVVDALDLCYTKSHVNTFVIISGDSDFSPLVSKLRENAKKVIGVGVKQSTSDLLIANCDEFIFYDDLVREGARGGGRRQATDQPNAPTRRTPEEEARRKESLEEKRSQAIEMAVETFDALVAERGDSGKIWASMLKEAIKRRKPDFNESYYGFKAFGNLLEEAQARGLLEFGRDDRSGAYVFRASSTGAGVPMSPSLAAERRRSLEPAALDQDHESDSAGDLTVRRSYFAVSPEAALVSEPTTEESNESPEPAQRATTRSRRGRRAAPTQIAPSTDQSETPSLSVKLAGERGAGDHGQLPEAEGVMKGTTQVAQAGQAADKAQDKADEKAPRKRRSSRSKPKSAPELAPESSQAPADEG